MENTEQLKGFEVFEIKPQLVAKGKKTQNSCALI